MMSLRPGEDREGFIGAHVDVWAEIPAIFIIADKALTGQLQFIGQVHHDRSGREICQDDELRSIEGPGIGEDIRVLVEPGLVSSIDDYRMLRTERDQPSV